MAAKSTIYLLAGLVFSTWAVSIAGLSGLQNQCADNGDQANLAGIEKFSAILTCTKIYRYWWYVVAIEVFAIFGLILVNALGWVRSQRASWAGIFSVLLLLYISMADAFLTAQDWPIASNSAAAVARVRTTVAGSIMTCVVNAFIVIALGTEFAPEAESEKKEEEKATI